MRSAVPDWVFPSFNIAKNAMNFSFWQSDFRLLQGISDYFSSSEDDEFH